MIADYRAYIEGFLRVRDERIAAHVNDAVERGLLWPDPWLSLNPAFEAGGGIQQLVAGELLHGGCAEIFRRENGDPLVLHRHQREAIEAARAGASYVLTTGTGSGKSLAYMVPIVDHVLRTGSGAGIKGLVVYPMNALANSQVGELTKFLGGNGRPRVTFARYTGQEKDEERERILADPPDILLTNYVMLDLLLTRPDERRRLVTRARELRFLVLDELHTYRGRQGADVAMLVRRVRDACGSPAVQCVGTSATLAGPGTADQQRAQVAKVATRLFGVPVQPEHVVGETLRRATTAQPADGERLREAVLGGTGADLVVDPLAGWVESTFGVVADGDGQLRRQTPATVPAAAATLAKLTGLEVTACESAMRQTLLEGSRQRDELTGFPLFAFRLHQFIGKGDTVYVSMEREDTRHITTQYQPTVPHRPDVPLFPLAFCRECGQEYLAVARVGSEFQPRVGGEIGDAGHSAGYLYINTADPWPRGEGALVERLPDSWLVGDAGMQTVDPARRDLLPHPVQVMADGTELSDGLATGLAAGSAGGQAGDPGGTRAVQAAFVPAPFRFCLRCKVTYESARQQDFAKLANLGSEGRSSATTVIAGSIVRQLREEKELDPAARKLLAFTDNRQDASLQAGHFNDFAQVGLLRSALYAATERAGTDGLTHDVLAGAVVRAMGLPREGYAVAPGVKGVARSESERALREVVAYRLYVDLQRGWRITMPNLEQAGLLDIGYTDLDELAADESEWAGSAFALIPAQQRGWLARVLLDEMRRALAVRATPLTPEGFEVIQALSDAHLSEPWGIRDERPYIAGRAWPRSQTRADNRGDLFVSGLSMYGRLLRRELRGAGLKLTVEETQQEIRKLLKAMEHYGLVHADDEAGGTTAYQVNAAGLRWCPAQGTSRAPDPIRSTPGESGGAPNPYFVAFYRDLARSLTGLRSAEHTAQVPAQVRQQREQSFRSAALPVLFCSPTMELGVDIATLNAVVLRNVPPTPANYAQRSGRAGRSGQPAVVVTYCTTGSSHDMYYFRRSSLMVAGAVVPPRIELSNQDLVRSHVHAMWLAETGQPLYRSLVELLDAAGEDPSLALQPEVRQRLEDAVARQRALARARKLLDATPEVAQAPWYDGDWLERTLYAAPDALDRACDRWRSLFRAAQAQLGAAHRVISDAAASADAVKQAQASYREAGAQLDLLRNESELDHSDFYSYRYFASEGFLPGYSFPRLPLSAFIPARRGARHRGRLPVPPPVPRDQRVRPRCAGVPRGFAVRSPPGAAAGPPGTQRR